MSIVRTGVVPTAIPLVSTHQISVWVVKEALKLKINFYGIYICFSLGVSMSNTGILVKAPVVMVTIETLSTI